MADPAGKNCPELNRVAGFRALSSHSAYCAISLRLTSLRGAYCLYRCLRAWAGVAVQLV